jgi:hypothetical protein
VTDKLAALVAERRDLDQKIAMQVDSLVRYGAGWPEIAAALGVTRQAARQAYGRRHASDHASAEQLAGQTSASRM